MRHPRHVVAFLVGLLLGMLAFPFVANAQAVPSGETASEITPLSGLVVIVRNESGMPARVWLVREDADPVVLIVIPPKTARAFHVKQPRMREGGEFTGCAWELAPRQALVAEPVKVGDGQVMTCLLPAGATLPPAKAPSDPQRSTEDA